MIERTWPSRSRPPAVWLDRWVAALTGQHRHRAIGVTLAAYGALWTVYRLISTLPRDIHFDMSELYAWSRALALGYHKHPPLSAFIVRVWFTIFPANDFFFTLLTVVNIVLTLYVVWLMLERWTDPAKAVFGVALLILVPFSNFQALKYNANTVLLPVWAFTAYAFLRAFETRSSLWSVLAGLGAGAAMLGKYWSIFLIAGLVLAALIDPRKRAFFRSPAPYLMVLAGFIAIAPHLYWLIDRGEQMFGYAGKRFEGEASVLRALLYAGGTIGYAVAPIAVWAWLLRPDARAVRDIADPADPQRTLTLLCFMLPTILPLLAAPWLDGLTPLWAMAGYSLLPLVLLASPLVQVDRAALRKLLTIAAALSLGALLASPIVAWATHTRNTVRSTDYGSFLAKDLAARWPRLSPAPIRLVVGCGNTPEPAESVAYAFRMPTTFLNAEQARADLLAHGGVLIATANDSACQGQGDAMMRLQPRAERYAATYQPSAFGFAGPPYSYVAYLIPPP